MVPGGGRERGAPALRLSHTKPPGQAASGAAEGRLRDVSWSRERPSAARPPAHRVGASKKNGFGKKTRKKKRRCSCTLESFTCPTEVLSALLSLRDRVSLLCSAVAQHPSSELIRSMHF